jgi:hypothetical protein
MRRDPLPSAEPERLFGMRHNAVRWIAGAEIMSDLLSQGIAATASIVADGCEQYLQLA